jgi:Methylamine utilisation protein MauE
MEAIRWVCKRGVDGLLGLVPFLLFFTAVGKLLAWSEFEASVNTFALVPEILRAIAAVLVPAGEALTLVIFLLGYRVLANVLSLGIVSVFFCVTLWHWLANVPPECACMGVWAEYWQIDESASGVMRRDAYLMGFTLVAVVLASLRRRRRTLSKGGKDVVPEA